VSATRTGPIWDSQAERLTPYCAAKGWKVSKVVKESALRQRCTPQLLALLADPSVQVIVIEHKDR